MTVIVRNKTPLVVPQAVRRQAGLKGGQEIEFKVADGVITIFPKNPPADEDCTPAQRRVIDARLAEGLADIDAGRVRGPYASHKAFIDSLHKETKKSGREKSRRSA